MLLSSAREIHTLHLPYPMGALMKPTSSRSAARRIHVARSVIAVVLLLLAGAPALLAREWTFVGIPQPMEAEFIGMKNGGVVLQGSNGKSFEVPFTSFTPEDQKYLKLLEAGGGKIPAMEALGKPITSPRIMMWWSTRCRRDLSQR